MYSLLRHPLTSLWSSCLTLAVLAVLFMPLPLLAATFTHTYAIGTPNVRMLPDGTAVVDIAGADQDARVPGAPLVPMLASRLHVPNDQVVNSVEVVLNEVQALPGTYTLAHAVSPQPISARVKKAAEKADPGIYSRNDPYPPQAWRRASDQWLHGLRIVITNFFPVRYYPASGKLEYAASVTVTVHTSDGRAAPADRLSPRTLDSDLDAVRDFIDNDESISRQYDPNSSMQPDASRQYLLITTEALQSAFAPLLAHRATSVGGGLTTFTATVENIDATKPGRDRAERIRNFIIESYVNHGTRYVLLGGHAHGVQANQAVPTRGCIATVGGETDSYIPSDYYYACLDGNWDGNNNNIFGEPNDGPNGADIDWLPEVVVGRIPAETQAEVQNAITKIIAYESSSSNPYRALLVGEKMDETPTWGGDRTDYVYQAMNGMPRDTLYDRDNPYYNWPKSTLISALSGNSYNLIFHLGHSNVNYNMKIWNTDLASISNSAYFFVYSQGCYSASFDRRYDIGTYSPTNSIGEDFLVKNAHNAFTYIGNSRYGWYYLGSAAEAITGASNLVHRKFAEALFQQNISSLGEANNESKKTLDYTSSLYRWISFELNLIGDPVTALIKGATRQPSLFWRNTDTGRNKIQQFRDMIQTGVKSFQSLDPVWQICGSGDFNGDRQTDVVWRNSTTGEVVLWLIDNKTPTTVSVRTVRDQAWQIQATGDFNRDGRTDLLWRNTATGKNEVWYMDGTNATSATFTELPDTNWAFAGTGDFNNDGFPDVVLRNYATGENAIWYLNGITVVDAHGIAPTYNTSWRIVAVTDFNGDNFPDIVWRNKDNGMNAVWIMNRSLAQSTVWVPTVSLLSWTVGGAGTF